MMELIIKHLFFRLDPESAHQMVERLLRFPFIGRIIGKGYRFEHPRLQRTVFGLPFPNPVGLAAGFDKNARMADSLARLGFGFVEIGTVTPRPQKGNPLPRLFRLPEDRALINRMGFNNDGVAVIAQRLRRRKENILVGGNIGKNKTTPNAEAWKDYQTCFETLFPYVDYFVVNVSSPNTPHLRELQDKEPLTHLLTHLRMLNQQKSSPKPILLKISPDLPPGQLDDIVTIVRETGIDGVIATNTTIAREGLLTPTEKIKKIGDGGLSGQPLKEKATEVIRYLHNASEGRIPIIGVGGIMSPEDALEKLEAGASLVQLFTGFVYEGPKLIYRIKKQLVGQ